MGWNVKHPCLPQYANKFSSPYFIASLKIVMPWPILPPLQNNNVPHQSQLILNKYIALGSGLWRSGPWGIALGGCPSKRLWALGPGGL